MKRLFLQPGRLRSSLVIALLSLLLAACSTSNSDRLYLTDWSLSWHLNDYPATVPGFIHTDLMANGLIDDPYYGTNEDSARWVEDREWRYRCHIDRNRLPKGDTLWLVFEGLAGRTNVILYGQRVKNMTGEIEEMYTTDNMFVQYTFPLPPDCEDIEVVFLPLDDSLREASYGIPLPDRRAFTRIAPYQQGWDWGPKLPTCGIWKPVYITNKAKREISKSELKTLKSSSIKASSFKVELCQKADSIGQSFTFYKDGKPIFIKGANWIPVHSFPVLNNEQKARYRHLLCSAKEANFNMLRVWGGGIYEHDYFYELCDSLGIMVWQDFNFSTMLYPDNFEMLESIDKEARQNITRIAKHPCIVLWCGNNEVKNGWEDWGWQGQFNWTPEQRARLEKAMDTIFGYPNTTSNTSSSSILAKAVRDCDPLHRPYITTSPLYGWGHPECTTHGDSHYWGVWWGEEPFEKYKEKTGRFMSEYGFQSYPLLSSIIQFTPAEQLNIDSPTLRSHQKHPRGREIIDKAMQRYYGFDSHTLSLKDYAYVSQLLQAWGTGYGILCHLSDPRCSGTLYWQLNDCWPVASWSSIDYYGNWKALHYRAQALYADTVDLSEWQHYYSVYPKDRHYDKPRFHYYTKIEDGKLNVYFQALTDIYDVCLETNPKINGHFTRNFFNLKRNQFIKTTLVPVDPNADINNIQIDVTTLNEIMLRK